MKIKIISLGRSNPNFISEGVQFFNQKIKHFCDYEWIELLPKKKFENPELTKKYESELLLKTLDDSDHVILLDEGGKKHQSSKDFSEFLNRTQASGVKRVVFIIGGAFGFDESIYSRSNSKISMASLTFSHQMIRLIFLEQMYRGYAILNHLPYHHE
ncbi:MAG: 23S rRNA (pseudouridine(1915)-N(3))-methyltransferase RlmH [Chitinophagales bacterium]